MKNILKTIVIIFSFAVSAISFASDITMSTVNNIITQLDASTTLFDTEKISKLFSNNATITIHFSIHNENKTDKYSKDKYIAWLKKTWKYSYNYKFHRSNVTIDLQKNKAVYSSDIWESGSKLDRHRQPSDTTTKEVITIQVIDGRPLITKVIAHTKI